MAQVAAGVVEAGWLVALAIVPLEVAVGTDRPFEPAKAVVVQVLAVVMAGAWLGRRLSAPTSRPAGPGGPVPVRAFVAATAALAVVATAGTALSLSPTMSLAGSSARSHGLFTLAAVWVIAVMAATELRDQRQVTRLLHVATVAAVPVAAVALLQRHGIDAVPVDRVSRPGSTFGNPLLLAGWLVTVTPLVAARLGVLLSEGGGPDRADRRRQATAAVVVTVAAAVMWWTAPLLGAAATVAAPAALWAIGRGRPRRGRVSVVAAAQAAALGMALAAVVATVERGPTVGLAAGAVVATLAVAAGRGRSRLLRAASVGVLATVAVLAVVTLRAGGQAGDAPEAIGAAVSLDRGTFAVRDRLWAAGEAALEAGEPLRGADGDDPQDAWRPLVGYGPDVTDAVLGKYADRELWRLEGRDAPADRAHNAILDAVLQFGWVGGAAFASVFAIGVAAAMRRLEMLATGKARTVAAALVAAGGAGGATAGAVAGPGWWAPGAGLGVVAAIAAALTVLPRSSPPSRSAVLVTAGCAGALVAHWVELQGSVETVASMTTWWLLAAVLVAPWPMRGHEAGGPTDVAAGSTLTDALAALTGLVAGTALHAGSHGSPAGTAWAVAVTVVIGTALAAPPTRRRLLRSVTVTLATAAAVAVPAAALADRGEQGSPIALGMAASVRVLVVVGMLLTLGAALAANRGSVRQPPVHRRAPGAGLVAVTLATTLAVLLVGVGPAVAALWRGTGAVALGPGDAHQWTTRADRLDLSLHGTVASATTALRAAFATPPEERSRLLRRARHRLASAARAAPFSAEETISLADVHLASADQSATPGAALTHVTEAADLYAVAANLRPGAPGPRALQALTWTEVARMQPDRTGQASASASRALTEAARLDPTLALIPAVRALLAPSWQRTVAYTVDAFAAVRKPSARRDRYDRAAAAAAHEALTGARQGAEALGEGEAFVAALGETAARRPSVDAYLALARSEAALGDGAGALAAVERGRTLLAAGDHLAAAALDAVMADLGTVPRS